MIDSLLQQDAEHRRRALDLESFIVEAPAGAGKTELLTQRYLRLLATVDEPEEIIAITFTNKAAGEMRQRIAESLDMARSGVLPAAEHKRVTFELATAALARAKELDWQIETQPGRLRLTTIDALCASLARQMPYLSRFGAQPTVAEDVQRHYEEAARRALDHLDSDGDMADAVAVALAHLDNDSGRLATLLAQMLARREQWRSLWQMHAALDHPESALGSALAALVSEDLAGIVDSLGFGVQDRAMPLARYAADNLGGGPLTDWSEPLGEDPDDLPCWRALADFLLTKEGERRKQVTVKNGFPPADKAPKAAMLELLASLNDKAVIGLRRLRELPAPAQGDDAVIRALVQLLQLAAAELWLVFRERGEVDFGELAARAIAALGDESAPSELALRLDYRIRHLLVDEFQDTSPLQIELLARLTAGWQPGDGRTLFAVGDPMQSIYRFRKADVGLFLRVAESGIGALHLEKLRLSRNNRSHPEVVDWINAHFPAVFPAADEPLRGEIRYRPFVATREPLADAGVSIHPVLADEAGDDRDDKDAREARTLIDIIAAEWRAGPQRTIAVLVRARGHLSALVAAIHREAPEWRFSAVEIEPLAGRQVVQDLISLTRALHHRADRLHWLAILRAPWCGLTLADLHALAGDDHAATVWSLMNDAVRVARLSADGQCRLAHVRGVLAEALAGQGRQGRRRWLEDVWKKLGGLHCTDAAGSVDASAFFNRLDVLDAAARFTVDSLDDDMGRLFAAADAQADGRLQLMTVHKSKGLEFDTVILPGLHREPSGRDTPLLAWDTFALADGERLVAAPVNPHRGKSIVPTVYDFLQRMERERSSNEEARVLYVAATRAVRRLHLVGVALRKDDADITTPRAASALGRLWPALEAEFLAAAAVPPAPTFSGTEDLALFVPQLVRLAAPKVPPAWCAPIMSEPVVRAHDDTADPLAAAVGTLTHACLEQIAAAPESWSSARANSLLPALVQWLASRGWAPAEAQSGAARTAEMLVTTLDSEIGHWVVRQRDDMAAELVLSKVGVTEGNPLFGTGGAVQTRVIDRCFVEDGVRWIVDYKTARIAAGVVADAQIEQQLTAHAERYREQLEEYGALLAGENLPQRLAVFYLAYGRLIVLE
jgi:ATP-dependent exoDNAse (exonuclease V) beta subunit